MSTRMKVFDLAKIADNMAKNDLLLRPPVTETIKMYADAMEGGAQFPPVIVGKFPHMEKYGSVAIVDGVNRIMAADLAKLKEFPIQEVPYKTMTEMLADMYARNMAHGLPVTEGQRNARIKLLRAQGLTLQALATMFKLGKSSIERIEKGEQGEGKSGRKAGGAIRSKGQSTNKPMKAAAIHKAIVKLTAAFELKKPNLVAEYENYLSPATEAKPDGEVDEDKLEEITTLIAFLQQIVKDVTNKA